MCKEYLNFIEEISYQYSKLKQIMKRKDKVRIQALMYEVFKRVVNNENLPSSISESMSSFNESVEKNKIEEADFIPNYKTPSIRA